MSELVKSKKFWMSVVATIIVVAMLVAGYDVQSSLAAAGPASAYIIAQGVSDHGKESAKIEADGNFDEGP